MLFIRADPNSHNPWRHESLNRISAGLNGAVWPMYGVLLAQAIGTLSQKDIEMVHSGGIKVAHYFFTLALCAAIVLWMQK